MPRGKATVSRGEAPARAWLQIAALSKENTRQAFGWPLGPIQRKLRIGEALGRPQIKVGKNVEQEKIGQHLGIRGGGGIKGYARQSAAIDSRGGSYANAARPILPGSGFLFKRVLAPPLGVYQKRTDRQKLSPQALAWRVSLPASPADDCRESGGARASRPPGQAEARDRDQQRLRPRPRHESPGAFGGSVRLPQGFL